MEELRTKIIYTNKINNFKTTAIDIVEKKYQINGYDPHQEKKNIQSN